MAHWTFADGTELTSGGGVKGSGDAADGLRSAIEDGRWINVLPHPAGSVQVTADSDYLLDALAKVVAYEAGRQRVQTSYVPNLDDAPADVRAMIERYNPGPSDADTVY